MDTSRLSQGEKIAAICSGLLVLFSFFPMWAKYEYDFGSGLSDSESYTAWSDAFNFLSKLAILLALAVLVILIVKAFRGKMNLPVSAGLLYVVLGGLTSLILLLLVITGPRDISDIPGVPEIDLAGLEDAFSSSRGIMLFVGLALAIGILVGGYMHLQNETDEPIAPTTPPPAS